MAFSRRFQNMKYLFYSKILNIHSDMKLLVLMVHVYSGHFYKYYADSPSDISLLSLYLVEYILTD